MKKHKKLYVAITILILVILVIVVNSIKICSIYSHDADYVYGMLQNKYNPEKTDVCILSYDYVTGTGWRVEQSTNKDIENDYVCLNSMCNPRLLKVNKDFDLDYMAKYVVAIDNNITQTTVDDKEVNVIKVKEIVITNFYYHNDGFDDLRFGDLTFGGKLKSMITLFLPKFRLQM